MHFSQSFAAKLTAGLLAVTGMIAPAFAVSGTVDAEGGLRLRNASSTDAAVLETIPDGSQIEVSGITESGWYQVSFQDTQGYVSTDYVVLSETVELPTVAEPVYGKVTEGPLNVRSAPSTDSEKVDSFSTGKVLTILETLDGWYKVEEGYVSADYVAPPYWETRAGKSQMLPIPTAEPMQARMNPHLDPQESRTALCFSMERRPFSKNTAGTRENRQGPCGPCRVTFF